MRSPCDSDEVGSQGDWYVWALEDAALLLQRFLRSREGEGGGLPQGDLDRYTHGECATLAAAAHALTGWPVVLLGDGEGGCVGWVHAGVMTPGLRVLDAAGDHDPGAWLEMWGVVVDAYGDDHLEYCGSDVQISELRGSPSDAPGTWYAGRTIEAL